MSLFLILACALGAFPTFAAPTVLVGDSHMAGTLGDALVPLLGGPAVAHRYGIVSASAELTYTTNAPVRSICPNGCTSVCPANAVSCPYSHGYRRPQDTSEQSGRVPADFPRMKGLLAEEKDGLRRVILELGTNDANIYGCSDLAVTNMAALLDQIKAVHPKSCVFVGPPAYLEGSPIYQRCGANYNPFVDKLLATAREKGCLAIDSRQVEDENGPIRCLVGGFHCTPAQAALWAHLVVSQLKQRLAPEMQLDP